MEQRTQKSFYAFNIRVDNVQNVASNLEKRHVVSVRGIILEQTEFFILTSCSLKTVNLKISSKFRLFVSRFKVC